MYNKERFLELFPRLMNELAGERNDIFILFDSANKEINTISDKNSKNNTKEEKSLRQLLSGSMYPASSIAIQRLNDLLMSVDLIAKCPEVHNRAFFYKHSYLNREYILKFLPYANRNTTENLCRIRYDFPVILCSSEDSNVSCMNYADKRVVFTFDEFSELTEGAVNEGIDLNTVIKYSVINVPMSISGIAVLFDDKSREDSLFADYYDGIFPSLNTIHELSDENFKTDKRKKYYGIDLRFSCISEKIICFYNKQINDCSEIIKNITDDLIRLGGDNEMLSNMRSELEKNKSVLEEESMDLQKKLSNIYNTINEIERKVGNTPEKTNGINKSGKYAAMELVILNCESNRFEDAEKYADTYLRNNHYYDFINGYINSMKTRKEISLSSLLHINDIWLINKMAIACSDISHLSTSELPVIQKWIRSIDGNITTAKEKYALSLTYLDGSPQSNELLEESFLEGYAPAGKLLFERFNTSQEMVDFLADLIQTDADIMKGKETISEESTFFIFESGWFWYKLAAAAGSIEAAKLIADKIYEDQVSYLPSFYHQLTESRKKAIDALMVLCQHLIDAGVNQLHYTHVLGIIYYLKKNFPLAMEKLSGANSKIANYCKGKMYANGWGTSKNLNMAVSCYSKAGNFGDAVTLYNKASAELKEKKAAAESKTHYEKSESYKTTSSNHHSSGGCFITTAAVKNLKAADNCEELELMRAFRDKYLTTSDTAQRLVLEYYKIAPEICKKIDSSDDSSKIYKDIWDNYISKSITCIKNGEISRAQLLYIKMTLMLAQKYDVQVNNELVSCYIKQIEQQEENFQSSIKRS